MYLVHVRATRFPFSPMCLRLGQVGLCEGAQENVFRSCHVRVPNAMYLGWAIYFEGARWNTFRSGSFRMSANVSNLLRCECPVALCTFVRPVFHLIPFAFIRSGVLSHAIWGHQMKHFYFLGWPYQIFSVLITWVSCACSCSPFFVFSPMPSFVWAHRVTSCECVQWNAFDLSHFISGFPLKCVWVGSFLLRVVVWNFLSYDCLGALCMFV